MDGIFGKNLSATKAEFVWVNDGNTANVALLWPKSKMRFALPIKYLFSPFIWKYSLAFLLFFLPWGLFAQAPLLEDKPTVDSLRKATDHLYNGQFEAADLMISRLKTRHNQHPGLILLSCISSFWRHIPINGKPKEFAVYEKNLELVIDLSEKMQMRLPKSPEPVFYQMMAHLILARHQSESGEYIKAVNNARKAYPFIKRGFSLKAQYPDFYFSTGLFNYFREAFPENHPIYKPFTVFFPDGNKALGIKELEIASQKSIFSRAEAFIFLGIIHMRDMYQVPAAMKYATQLHEQFPGNWLFTIFYAEALIESHKPAQAEPFVVRLLGRHESVALQTGFYLKGLIEKSENKVESARSSFQKSLAYGRTKDRLTKGFVGLVYCELGKIAREEGKPEQARKYFRLALENCAFKKVKDEAKRAGVQ